MKSLNPPPSLSSPLPPSLPLKFCLGFSLPLNRRPEVPQDMCKAGLSLRHRQDKNAFQDPRSRQPSRGGGGSRHPPGGRRAAAPVARGVALAPVELRAGPPGRRREPPVSVSLPHSRSPFSPGPPSPSSSSSAAAASASYPWGQHQPPAPSRSATTTPPPRPDAIGRPRVPWGDAAF